MKTQFIIIAIFLCVALLIVGTVAQWFGLRLARVPIKLVTIFYGPRLATFRLFGDPVFIGFIPTGGNVDFDVPQFRRRPLPVRFAMLTLGAVAMAIVAFVILGFANAAHHIGVGFIQILDGAFHPLTVAQQLMAQLQSVYTESFVITVGILSAKLTAFSLLPIGSMVTVTLVQELLGRHREHRAMHAFSAASGLFGFFLLLSWTMAMITYAARI